MKFPAIVLENLGTNPTLQDVSFQEPGADEVLVRMVASGICHTDLGYVKYARACPVLLGHEGAGIVEKTGDKVDSIKPGDHVVINWQPKCNKCRRCLAGRNDLCENIQGTSAHRVFWRDEPLNVMLNAGTFCPRVIVRAAGAVVIRSDMPLEKAALLGCAVATGVGAVLYTANVQAGENVAVIGTGGVGLNVVQGAKRANANKIIAIDIDEQSLQTAEKFGATHTINSKLKDSVKMVREITDGKGVEHVFEIVGLPKLMQDGIDMLARGGELTLIGAADREAEFSFKPRAFMSQQQVIRGCIYGNIRPGLDLALFADWYMNGLLRLDELHTRTISLDEVPEYFANPETQSGIRTVIKFEEI